MSNPSESITQAKRVKAAERRQEAVKLRIAGATFQQIGDRLGMTRQGAHVTIKRYLYETAKATEESADELRVLELQRLDALQASHWSDAMKGDIQKTLAILRIMNRRAALMGLDAPVRAEIANVTPVEIVEVVRDAIKDGEQGDAQAPSGPAPSLG